MEISHGWICGPKAYDFVGIIFEFSPMIGPWPLKKNGDPKKRARKKFYDFYKRFSAMPSTEQERYRIGGGCARI